MGTPPQGGRKEKPLLLMEKPLHKGEAGRSQEDVPGNPSPFCAFLKTFISPAFLTVRCCVIHWTRSGSRPQASQTHKDPRFLSPNLGILS